MDWLRLYGEFSTDAKVQSMSEAMQRRLIMLMCLRCSNVLETLHDDELAFALRINEDELAETKALFMRKGFISDDWELLNWEKRQYVSDSSTERVRRHREKKKEVLQQAATLQSRCSNALDTDTDTDTEKITTPPTPRSRGKAFDACVIELPSWLGREDWQAWVADRKDRGKPITKQAAVLQVKQLEKYRCQGFSPHDVISHSIAGGYQGLFPADRRMAGNAGPSRPSRSQARADWNTELRRELGLDRPQEINMGLIDGRG